MSVQLSFSKGKRLAKIVGGAEGGKTVYLYDPAFKCCPDCSTKCNEKKKCCKKCSQADYHTAYNPENVRMMLEKIQKGKIDEIEIAEEDEVQGVGQARKSIVLRGGIFQQVPSNQPYNCPDLMYVSGRRGSGKSYYIAEYLKEFKKYYPRFRIYLFSQKQKDDLLDEFVTKRIDLTKVKDALFCAEDFKGSLCIFDDVDTCPSEKTNNIKEAVYKIMDDVIETGRSLGIFCIVTSHLGANSKESKRILNGCTSFTLFLNSSSHQTEYCLKTYFGFSPKQVQKLLALEDTRYVTIFRDCPQIVMSRTQMMFQSELK